MMMRPQLARAFAEVDWMKTTAASKKKPRVSNIDTHKANLCARLHLAMDAKNVEKSNVARKRWLIEQAAIVGKPIDDRTADRLINAESRAQDDTFEALDLIFGEDTKAWRLSASPPENQQTARAIEGTSLLVAAKDFTPSEIGKKAEQLANQSGEDRVAIAMLLAFWEASAKWSRVSQVGKPS